MEDPTTIPGVGERCIYKRNDEMEESSIQPELRRTRRKQKKKNRKVPAKASFTETSTPGKPRNLSDT
jgi:hypothetical protein